MNAWDEAYQRCLIETVDDDTITIGRALGLWVVSGLSSLDRGLVYWLCRCVCGTERPVLVYNLLSGGSRSCGCVRDNLGKREHPIEHGVWSGMIERCVPTSKDQERYYDRGIGVCAEWLGRLGFLRFYEDMGSRPSSHHQIDRKNNDLGYSKENCRWATVREQAQNRRSNVHVEFRGERKPIAEWARQMGVSRQALRYRLRQGWSVEQALTTPVDHGNGWSHGRLATKEKNQ